MFKTSAGEAYQVDLRGVACLNYLFKRHWKRRKLPNATRTTELTVSPLFRSKKTLNLAVNTYCPLNYVCVDQLFKTNLAEPGERPRPKKARLSEPSPTLRSHTLRSQVTRQAPRIPSRKRSSSGTQPRPSNVCGTTHKRAGAKLTLCKNQRVREAALEEFDKAMSTYLQFAYPSVLLANCRSARYQPRSQGETV